MYRLLIVDDEKVIVSGLYELFSEAKHLNLDICKAYSGTEALQWFNKTKIDIVLTDIKMPGMNGLQLLEEVRSNWPQCKIIFLTGYEEFEYVYTAIKYEGVKYLVKTEKDEVIVKAVEEAVKEIEESFKAEEIFSRIREKMKTALPVLQKEYLSELLMGENKDFKSRRERFEELEIPLDPIHPVLVFIGCIDSLSNRLTLSEKMQYCYMIKGITEKYLADNVNIIQIIHDGTKMISFMQPKDIAKHSETTDSEKTVWQRIINVLKGTLETIQTACKNTLSHTVSYAVSDEPVKWETLFEKYKSLCSILDYHMSYGAEMIVLEGAKVFDNKNVYIQQLKNNESEEVDLLCHKAGIMLSYLESRQKNGFDEILNEIVNYLVSVKSMNNNFALELYYSVSLSLLSYINHSNMVEKLVFKIGIGKLTHTEEHDSWIDACKYLKNLSEYIFEIQSADQENRTKSIVSLIKKYINENPGADMSLTKLADMVYYNPSYLSRVFKQVTGINLIDYITETKINKAKELLKNSNMKILEIAAYLGYDSSAYFARSFKKAENITPQEFRDSEADK